MLPAIPTALKIINFPLTKKAIELFTFRLEMEEVGV